MVQSARQFDLKFLLVMIAIVAAGLAGWKVSPVLLGVNTEPRWWIVLGFYVAPFLFLVGLAVDRELLWWMCPLVGLFLPAIFIAGASMGFRLAAIVGLFFGDAAIVMFCLVVSIRALRHRTKIATAVVGVLASWWMGFTLASM